MKVQAVLISTLLSVLAVSADSSQCTEGVQYFPSSTDCTQFYQCDALGVAVPMQCQDGLYFDPIALVCIWNSGECVITTTEEVITTSEAATTTPEVQTTTTEAATTPEIGTEAPIVNEECTEGVTYFPSSTDCSQYYQCTDLGQAMQMNCPPGLEFHPTELVCDWPNGFCSIGGTTTEGSTGTAGPTEEPETTTAPEINEECPEIDDPANPVHLPHPTDCGKFFKCLQGVAYEHTCPEGQHWSIENNWCDFPENANCPMSTTESSGTDGTDGTVGTTTPGPEKHPDCPEIDVIDNPIHFPHPSDCGKFLKCLQGVAYEHDCPEGQHWSVENTWCDFPENANCVIEE